MARENKRVCLAAGNNKDGFRCIINSFSSRKKQEVAGQCPFEDDFGKCLEIFEEKYQSPREVKMKSQDNHS